MLLRFDYVGAQVLSRRNGKELNPAQALYRNSFETKIKGKDTVW